jgi:E3 ubiquitin-protein ligase HUWE1
MVRTLLQTIIQIMRADGEVNTRPDDTTSSMTVSTLAALANATQRSTLVVPSPPRPVVANEASIQVMVEMGFPRNAVVIALQRTHNNIARATDYILSHSELLMAEDTNEPAATTTTTTAEGGAEQDSNNVRGEDMELVETAEPSNTATNTETTDTADAMTDEPAEGTANATTAELSSEASAVEPSTENNEAEAESTEPAPTVEEDPILPLPKRPAPRDELKQLRQDSEVTILDHALELVDIIDDILVEVTELLLLMSKKRPVDIIHRLLDELVTIQEECATASTASTSATTSTDTADKSTEKKTPEHRLFVRYQLLGHLLLKDHSMAQQIQQHIPSFLSILLGGVTQQTDRILANSTSTVSDNIPRWLAPLLAVVECFLSLASEPQPVPLSAELAEGGLEVTEADIQPIVKISFEQKRILLQHCINLLRLTNETMLRVSALRLLVILSRDPHLAGELADPTYLAMTLPSLKRGGLTTLHANQAYITMILRNVIESPQVLRDTMEREIMLYYNFHRPRVLDVNNYLRTHTRVALRDPQTFIEATTAICRISHISANGPSPQITLKKSADLESTTNTTTDSNNNTDDRSNNSPGEAMSIDDVDQSSIDEAKRESCMRTETVIQLLLQQLLQLKQEETTTSVSISDEKSQFIYVYRCFLLQLLVELLLAYPHCQHCILSVPIDSISGKDQQMVMTPTTSTSSSHQQHPLIHHLLYDLLDHNASLGTRDAEAKKQMNLAICVDTFLVAMCTGSKDDKRIDNESLSQVRRTVLDGVWRALKEASQSKLPLDVKYGRILTLSDLCHRLLTATSSSSLSSNNQSNSLSNRDNNTNGRSSSELSGGLQVAQLMLDRGYVALLTDILSQIDLAFPMAKTVVNTLLRTLDPLAKSAIKLSRWTAATQSTSTKKTNAEGEEEERPSLDVFIERHRTNLMEDTPDLYRHSSLGMYETGGRLNHDYSFDEDEEDEIDTANHNGLDDIFMSDRGVINEDDHNDIHDEDNDEDDNDIMDDDEDDEEDEDEDDEDDVDSHDTNEANYHYDTTSDRSEPDITTDEHDDVDSDEIDMEIVVHEPYDNNSLAVMSSSDIDNDTHPDDNHDRNDIDDDDVNDDDNDEATISISGDLDSDAFDREDEFIRMIDENRIHEMLREGGDREGNHNDGNNSIYEYNIDLTNNLFNTIGSNRPPIDFSNIDWHQANLDTLFRSDDITGKWWCGYND